MIILRHTVSIAALSSLMLLGACGSKDAAENVNLPSTMKMSATPTSGKIMRKMLEVEDRKVSEAEAEQALKGLGLSDDSANWASKKGKAGDYQYKNLSFKTDKNKTVQVANLKLDGVHMDGEQPTFDRMSLSNVKIADDKTNGTIDSLVLSRPEPEMAARILDMLANMDSFDDIDLDIKDGDFGFGAMMLEGMNMSGDDGNMTIDTFGWGTDETTGKGAFLAENIAVTGKAKHSKKPFELSLRSLSASDIEESIMNQMGKGMQGKSRRGMSPMQSGFGNFQMQDFTMLSGTTSFNMTGFQTETKTKGDVTTERQVLSPIYIKFSPESAAKGEWGDQLKMLSKIGVNELQITGQATKIKDAASDTLTVTDSFFVVKDIMDVRYDLEARGTGARGNSDALSNFQDMSINRMNLKITDYSMVEKGMAIAGEILGTSPKMTQMNARFGLMALPMMGKTEADKELLSDVANVAADFLSEGGTLDIKMNPPTPITARDLERLASGTTKGLNKYGLTVTHQP